ncbi:Crp/Fnr family transcriptional regulator [Rhodobacteraceae bacterium]|nr:Crp/Fnr family transcriptional regulator [Paracoccaceae bacterium]
MNMDPPQKWSTSLLSRLAAVGTEVAVGDGLVLFSPGDNGEAFLIARSGSIRVEQTSPSGRSVVLYRVGPGDSCVMTTSCMLSGIPYSAYGYAEGDVAALAIGRAAFDRLLVEDAEFRGVVFAVFSHRLIELTSVIDDLLLNRMDQKLAHWLASQARTTLHISATHQKIAAELGSAREVMSRILKDFERRGWVTLERGAITIDDLAALNRHANSSAV